MQPLNQLSYSIKLVNPAKKYDYRIYKIRDSVKFESVNLLEQFIKDKFKEFRECNSMCIGYIEPGHGWKGKQRWINTDEDVNELYSVYHNTAKEILLWCHLPSKESPKKRKKSDSSSEPANKRARCVKNNDMKISGANEVFETLKKKHDQRYKPEQLHAWAQLVQMKKHESLDDPPDYPFFKGRRPRKQEELSIIDNGMCTPPDSSASISHGLSPGRKIQMRTECIEQLQRIGKLLKRGTISKLQYEKLQETIMKDINKF